MKRYLYAIAILSTILWNTTSAQVADSARIAKALTRCWRPISYEFSSIYGLEEQEIKRYSKQKICFTKDSITMYYGVLYAPRYSAKRVNAESFAKNNFDCSKQALGILADSIFEVTISSVSKPSGKGVAHKMTDVIAFDEDCIYVVVDGVIFKLFDADRKVEAGSSR